MHGIALLEKHNFTILIKVFSDDLFTQTDVRQAQTPRGARMVRVTTVNPFEALAIDKLIALQLMSAKCQANISIGRKSKKICLGVL